MRSLRWLAIPVALGAIALGLGACGGGGGSKTAQVNASEKEFTISLAQDTVKSGTQKFNVKNTGTTAHEFVIFKTDLDAATLPMTPDSKVDEQGQGVQRIDEVEDVTPGGTKTLSAHLAPGHYVVICNLVGHYAQGMHAAVTVQ